MFGNKKTSQPQIDPEQLELIQNAQRRIKQKKRLFIHLIVFLIGCLFFILANFALGIGSGVELFNVDWCVYIILIWGLLLLYHAFNVFVTHKFIGKDWEQKQMDKLVGLQQQKIEKIKSKAEKEKTLIAESQTSKKNNLTIIVAAGENNAIGKNNKLIWHLSDDLKRFKSLTNGHHIIMGRKTFESFPKPLPNRTHIVITRQEDYKVPDGVIVVNTLDDAIDATKSDSQPFIIGGGEIYKQAMNITNVIELTRVHENFEADTFFPKIDTSIWKEVNKEFHSKDDNHHHAFSFITYEKI